MRKKWQIGAVILGLTGLFAGHQLTAQAAGSSKDAVVGFYKTPGKADDGTPQPHYWYFAPDGKLYYYTPEVKSIKPGNDGGYFGEDMTGTWKTTGHHRYRVHLKDVYDLDYFDFTTKLAKNKLTSAHSAKGAMFTWTADTSPRQPKLTKEAFMQAFDQAKASDRSGIQENGTASPANAGKSATKPVGDTGVHLQGGDTSVAYMNKVLGDQGWTVTGGTYGGAHGAPTDGSYVPYNDVTNSKGDNFYVYQNGRIEPQKD